MENIIVRRFGILLLLCTNFENISWFLIFMVHDLLRILDEAKIFLLTVYDQSIIRFMVVYNAILYTTTNLMIFWSYITSSAFDKTQNSLTIKSKRCHLKLACPLRAQ